MATFADLGNAIGEAIATPAKMRLQVDELRRKRKRDDAEDQKLLAKEEYAKTLGQKYGPEFETAIRAGEGVNDLIALRKPAKGAGGGGRNREPKEDWGDKMLGLEGAADTIAKMASDASNELSQALAKGDKAAAQEAMQKMNAYGDAAEKVKTKVQSMDATFRTAKVAGTMSEIDSQLKGMDETKTQLLTDTFMGQLQKRSGMNKNVIDRMEETKDAYGLGIDLSGIPDTKSAYRFFFKSVLGKKVTEEQALLLLQEEDPDNLVEAANDDDLPEETRMMAGMLAKTLLASPWLSTRSKGRKMIK